MAIHTVLGPISPDELGQTTMHEHVLLDASVWHVPAAEELPDGDKVTLANRGFLQWNPLASRDNLVLDDEDAAITELGRVRAAGGSGLVDLTVDGIGRRVDRLPRIARASDLHIMVGCGYYIHESHPGWLAAATEEAIRDVLLGELRDGLDGTGIRPALIGEIGTSAPVTARELKVLTAAGLAAAETGAAINVHLDRRGEHALEVIDLLTSTGVAPNRIVCSHLDERLDWDYHRAIAATGAILEYDTFGQEFYFDGRDKNPTDIERMDYVARVVAEGLQDQLVLGCDIWVKVAMATYGGMGYEHLLRRIAPRLAETFGIDDAALAAMLVHTPRRLLDRPDA